MMRRRPSLWILAAAVVAPALAVASVTRSQAALPSSLHEHPAQIQALQPHPEDHRVPAIDGAQNPERISDERALSLFLLMAAHPDPRAGRSYVKAAFLSTGSRLTDQTAEAIRLVAVDYANSVKEDASAERVVSQATRSEILASRRLSVGTALGDGGTGSLTEMLAKRVKPRTRVFAKPQ